MKTLFLISILISISIFSQSQIFTKGYYSIVSTSQIIPENYFVIKLQPEMISDPNANKFDINNAETNLQILIDNDGKKYHILLQTNFNGKITFLSISNNLSALFNKREKPMFIFENCMQDINTYTSSIQNINAALSCVIGRLEYCSK